MSATYENPDKYRMIRNLSFAVDLYKDVIALKDPYYDFIRLREQIKKDHEEYNQLKSDLARPEYFEIVNSYLENFDCKSALGEYLEQVGEFIDRGNWTTPFGDTGRTYDKEMEYIREAYRLTPKTKAIFKRRYKYLLEKGQQDLVLFQNREAQNKVLYNNALTKIVGQDLEKHQRAIARAESKFKDYKGYPSPLYLAASNLETHIVRTLHNGVCDEYIKNYLTQEELLRAINEGTSSLPTSLANLARVEKFIEKIARNEIILSEINPQKQNPSIIDENLPQ